MNPAVFNSIRRQHYSAGEASSAELTIDSGNVQTFSASDFKAGDRTGGEIATSPSVIYSGGKTMIAYPMKWDTVYSSFGLMTYYDKNNGYYPAPIEVTSKGSAVDRHLTPVIGVNADGTFLVSEERDHSSDIKSFSGAADFSKFILQADMIAAAARLNYYRTPTGWACVHQSSDVDLRVATCGPDGTGWSATKLLITSDAGSRPYPSRPFGTIDSINGKYYINVIPAYTTGASIRVKFVILTEDFITYSNIQGTHSFVADTPVTLADLQTNGYAAVGSTGGTSNVGTFAQVLTPSGELFIFSVDASLTTSSPILTTTTWEGGAWVHRVCDTGLDINAPNVVDATFTSWAAARSSSEIYLMCSINSKPHMLKTTDKGATWTDISGDMLPGKTYYRGQGPFNTHDIPDNENFAIWFGQDGFDNVTPVEVEMYAVKAAFGSIQTETTTPFTDTVSELADIAGASFIYEADNYDVGVTGFLDKSSSGRNGTKIGTPTLSSGAVVFNGTNQGITIGGVAADFDAHDKFSLAAVAKWVSGDFYLVALANTSNGTRFCHVALTSTGITILYNNTSLRFQCFAVFDSTVFNVIQVSGDGVHFRIRVNGVELSKTYKAVTDSTFPMSSNGRWGDNAAPVNNVRIASVGRLTTPFYGGGQLKAIAYYPDVLSRTNRKKQLNKLAAKYSISVTNNVE